MPEHRRHISAHDTGALQDAHASKCMHMLMTDGLGFKVLRDAHHEQVHGRVDDAAEEEGNQPKSNHSLPWQGLRRGSCRRGRAGMGKRQGQTAKGMTH